MKGLKSYMIAGAIFTSVAGTLLHFAYEWSNGNFFVGLFTPINESIWEHTKLLFFPMIIYSLYLPKELKYPCTRQNITLGNVIGVLSIIVLFYTYSGVLGSHSAFIDISIFYISVVIAFVIAYKRAMSCNACKYRTLLQITQLAMICLYVVFTVFPPDIALFAVP